MITARPQKNLTQAKTYFREHLAHNDYYSESQSVQGEWFGKGAERLELDLAKAVTEEAFVRLCDNEKPLTGEQLTVRRRKVDRRVFFDFVVAPPKSVSVLALVVGDSRIVEAHRMSARAAFGEMEKLAVARVRRNGQVAEHVTGELVAAIFQHDTSRSLDPQLHTHFVVFNATFDPVEQRWKALETRRIFDHLDFLIEVYRADLSVRLQAFGYKLRNTAHGFEIEGVADAILQRFSKRRQAIMAESGRIEQEFGKIVPNNGRAAIAHAIRERKLKHLSAAEVRAFQRAQLSEAELAVLERLMAPQPENAKAAQTQSHLVVFAPEAAQTAQSMAASLVVIPTQAARAAIDFARDHLFERQSVVSRRALLREALKHGRGLVRLPELDAELSRRTEFLVQGDNLATKAGLNEEQRLIALVNAGIGRCRPLCPRHRADSSLTEEQRSALASLLQSADQVVALRGAAGTGKTQVLHALVEAVGGRQPVVMLAPTKSGVKALHTAGLSSAQTVQSYLTNTTTQQQAERPAIVVDEAGLLSNRQMLALTEHVHRKSGRLVLVGDSRQHASIEAGDALRVLERHSALRTVSLWQIQRQTDEEYRRAVAELAGGEGLRAVSRLERLGAILVLPEDERLERASQEYVDSVHSGKSALVVCPTWREIDGVNAAIRARLQKLGIVSTQEKVVTAQRSLKWTMAQKRDLGGYRAGLVLNFHKSTASFSAGESVEVLKVEKERLIVRGGRNAIAHITGKQASCFDVAKQMALPVAAGDRLILQGNLKREGLLNGHFATVKKIKRSGAIQLTNGQVIPPDFRLFTHSYAATSQAAQGRTVDHVIVVMDRHSLIAANEKQFYVSVSRGRERVKILTDELGTVRRAVSRPGTRLSAVEMLQAARQRPAEQMRQQRTVRIANG